MPVNWHLRCVLRIGWLGFPRVGKLYTGTFRFQESNDQRVFFVVKLDFHRDDRMRAMPQEYADESGSRTLQI